MHYVLSREMNRGKQSDSCLLSLTGRSLKLSSKTRTLDEVDFSQNGLELDFNSCAPNYGRVTQ